MKNRLLDLLQVLGHVQAQLILGVIFFIVLVPYAAILKLSRQKYLVEGHWNDTESPAQDLDALRRSF